MKNYIFQNIKIDIVIIILAYSAREATEILRLAITEYENYILFLITDCKDN
jgi:hypothetical protein